jgi:diguanylate cyclase
MAWLYGVLVLSVGVCLGIVLGIVISRRKVPVSQSIGASSPSAAQLTANKQIEGLISSLHLLTSHVDTQVGEHTLRVEEVTNSLTQLSEEGPAPIIAAGELLISANHRLQGDLENAKSELQKQREQMEFCLRESRTDALTNIPNRRAFDQEIAASFAEYRRRKVFFSLLMLDIDYFKRINDRHGHMVGDQALKSVAQCLLKSIREADIASRYGGEEFAIILPLTAAEEAVRTAERIRLAIANTIFRVGDIELQVTASIGVKEISDDTTISQLIERTDAALYAAKKQGRNRVYYHDGTQPQDSSMIIQSL